ncbi:hypothetical protein KBH77_00325 [Patescibacteria group bacterium]|nr:hypothetical protein [Patescibacteria group bacterium]
MENQEAYNAYKTLKNCLNKLSIDDSIYIIYNYHLYISNFKDKLPDDISVSEGFYDFDEIHRAIFNWELEIFLREILINSKNINYSEYYNGKETLKKWNKFSNYLNKLKDYENDVARIFINDKNARLSLNRIPHQQFKWQKNPYNPSYLFRYYKIFGESEINKLINKLFNLSVIEIYYIGFYLIGYFINNFELKKEDLYSILDKTKIDSFLELFSINIEKLKEEAKKRKLDHKFEYEFFVLEFFPIIKYQNNIFLCPLVLLIFWAFTSGIYFKIRYNISNSKEEQKIFDQAFGKSFELYIGEVMKRANKKKFLLLPEEFYSKPKKQTPDWIVYDNIDSAMFIECKTKRIQYDAKIEMDEELIKNELNQIVKASIQLYERIDDYRNNKFNTFKFNKKINIFPVILTLENWYMSFYLDLIRDMTIEACKNRGIDSSYLKTMPIAIFSCEEFEEIIQIINQVGIKKFMTQIHKRVFSVSNNIAVEPFIEDNFDKEKMNTIFLFQSELDKLLDDFKNKNI